MRNKTCVVCGKVFDTCSYNAKYCSECGHAKYIADGRRATAKRDERLRSEGYVKGLESLLDYVKNDCLLKESQGKEVSYKIACKIEELLKEREVSDV
jgi:hypothetical protein